MFKHFAPMLKIPPRSSKPRRNGITMVFDHGWPLSFIQGTIDIWADVIDVVKISYFHMYQPEPIVKRKIKSYRDAGVEVQAGGPFLEIGRVLGNERDVLKYLKRTGFDSLEIAAEVIPDRPVMEEEAKAAKLCMDMGLTIHGEVGKKFPEGDVTRKGPREINIEETVEEMKAYLEMGCVNVYWEGHLLRMVLGEMGERIEGREPVMEVAKKVGQDNIVFEVPGTFSPYASKRALQALLVHMFGPSVNIGNVLPEEINELEVIRAGNFPAFGAPHGDHPWMASLVRHKGKAAEEWWKGR